jgi:hypothetical protein
VSSPSTSVTPFGIATAVSAIAGNTEATVNWTAPAIITGIVKYKVTISPGGISGFTTDTSRSILFTGLTNGTAYTFTVQAVGSTNTILGAASSPSNAATPIGTPINVSGIPGPSQVTVSWTAPAIATGIVKYKVSTSGLGSNFTTDASTSLVITNLTPGQGYNFTVQAVGPADILGSPSIPSSTVVPTNV